MTRTFSPTPADVQRDWVIIDANDVIVHLFRPAVRQFYKLEDLWQTPPARAGK